MSIPSGECGQQERIVLLMEECAEVVQVCAKILRHGLYSRNPAYGPNPTNKELLEVELAHVMVASELLSSFKDLDNTAVDSARLAKLQSLPRWLHTEKNRRAVNRLHTGRSGAQASEKPEDTLALERAERLRPLLSGELLTRIEKLEAAALTVGITVPMPADRIVFKDHNGLYDVLDSREVLISGELPTLGAAVRIARDGLQSGGRMLFRTFCDGAYFVLTRHA